MGSKWTWEVWHLSDRGNVNKEEQRWGADRGGHECFTDIQQSTASIHVVSRATDPLIQGSIDPVNH